jgi:hypothetical protein
VTGTPPQPYRLPAHPQVPRELRSRLLLDFERFKKGLPPDPRAQARERYGIDLTGRYAGRDTRLPFGKASGQLSMTAREVQADADSGLGFVVLKTVIAQSASGRRTMGEWAIHETLMNVEPIVSLSGRNGWTVTWKGRGWDRSFEDYLALYAEARGIGERAGMPVAASVKYHLPEGAGSREPDRQVTEYALGEYEYTTGRLAEVASTVANDTAPGSRFTKDGTQLPVRGSRLLLEKDFSPTLAGDARAGTREAVLRWIRDVPGLIKGAAPVKAVEPAAGSAGTGSAPRPGGVTLGLKLMNALFDDAFQVEMLREAAANPGVDFLVLFNRLFDPARGVAYGGWDLSDRNVRVLDLARSGGWTPRPEVSATGNIQSGRLMVEYALRGATSGQVHTYFQLPRSEYAAGAGGRTSRALHSLVYHPEEGLLAWIAHLGETGTLARRGGFLHFLDIADAAARDAR